MKGLSLTRPPVAQIFELLVSKVAFGVTDPEVRNGVISAVFVFVLQQPIFRKATHVAGDCTRVDVDHPPDMVKIVPDEARGLDNRIATRGTQGSEEIQYGFV